MTQPSNTPPAEPADAGTTLNDVDLANETPETILGQEESPTDALDALLSEEEETIEDDGTEEGDGSEEESASDTGSEQPEGEIEADETESDETPTEDKSPARKMTPEEIEALYVSHSQLLSLKGRQGKDLGDARQEIAQLKQRLARLEGHEVDEVEAPSDDEEIPQTEEEWDALYATKPFKAQELHLRLIEEKREKEKSESVNRVKMEKVLVTPEVAATIFKTENGIENFDEWSESEEGVAVTKVVSSDKRAKLALLAAINMGDADEVAAIMADALKVVRGTTVVKKAGQVSKAQAKEIRSASPKSVPKPGRAVNPKPPSKLTEMSSDEILKLDDRTFAKLMSGR